LILFLFPHQDDEFFIAPKIVDNIESSVCFFLTKGDFYGADPVVRNKESLSVLTKLGLSPKNVFFLCETVPITDTFLSENLEKVFESILREIKNMDITEVYTTAFEGGHPDHDASAILASALGLIKNAKVFQYFLYNALNRKEPFFNVMKPITRDCLTREKIPLEFSLKKTFLFLKYKSQSKTWIGLGSFVIYYFLFKRFYYIQELNISILKERPHMGKLYYEARGWKEFEKFQIDVSSFVEKNFKGLR